MTGTPGAQVQPKLAGLIAIRASWIADRCETAPEDFPLNLAELAPVPGSRMPIMHTQCLLHAYDSIRIYPCSEVAGSPGWPDLGVGGLPPHERPSRRGKPSCCVCIYRV